MRTDGGIRELLILATDGHRQRTATPSMGNPIYFTTKWNHKQWCLKKLNDLVKLISLVLFTFILFEHAVDIYLSFFYFSVKYVNKYLLLLILLFIITTQG